jgi:hypothetical protein
VCLVRLKCYAVTLLKVCQLKGESNLYSMSRITSFGTFGVPVAWLREI